MAIGGVLRSLPVRWVNHPEKIVSADYKPFQLAVAHRLGFTVPRSLVTNDPEMARHFIDELGEVIYKPLSSIIVGLEEARPLNQFTRLVTQDDLPLIDAVRHAPCLFQERIEKAFELRVVVMESRVFSVAINSQNSERTNLDWRRSYTDLTYSVHEMDPSLERLCLELVDELGLVFAAIDLAVGNDGTIVFFELNSNGQWAWLEEHVDLPLVDSMVDLLAGDGGAHVT